MTDHLLAAISALTTATRDTDQTAGSVAEQRRRIIRLAHNTGRTLQAIADAAGTTRQRIHQIVHEHEGSTT